MSTRGFSGGRLGSGLPALPAVPLSAISHKAELLTVTRGNRLITMHLPFLFSTGIENSYPVLPNGRRIDQMEKCGRYDRWREDFGLVREMGVRALRYGPAYYVTHVG